MQYLEDEKKLQEISSRFRAVFGSVNNSVVLKSQKNTFGLYVKFPLFIGLLLALAAAVYIIQFALESFDALYIVCEVILTLGIAFVIVLMTRTWIKTIKNAKQAEEITYYKTADSRFLVTKIAGGGNKFEWADASLFISGDDFELIESKTKKYNPLFYKKLHGHSRGYRFFDVDFLVSTFFEGMTVLSDENGVVTLSSGFKFAIEYDVLKYVEVEGFYDECYENNFPLLSILPQSKSYVFKYEFTSVNVPNFRLILPDRTNEGAKLFFLELPEDKNIIIRS